MFIHRKISCQFVESICRDCAQTIARVPMEWQLIQPEKFHDCPARKVREMRPIKWEMDSMVA